MLKKLLLLSFVLLLALAVGLFVVWKKFDRYLDQPIAGLHEPVEIMVEPGSSVTRVIHQLADRDLLRQPRLLVYYLRATDQTGMQAGEYRIPAAISPRQLLARLARGEVKYYELTLLEGWTVRQSLDHMSQQPALEHELTDADMTDFLRILDREGRYPSAEGLFFPDTYRYVRGMSDKDLLTTAYGKMQQTLADEWPGRAEKLPLSSPYEALILASIVEKETAVDSEREQIAGVFTSRLVKGMRLQTDPTVIYAMGENYHGNIRRKDLQLDSPYNTYRVAGLPPTPIALPSRRSIEAVLHPLLNGKLYFVAKGDGSHYFSATLEEHNKAVQEYQVRNRAKNYRSAPGKASSKKADNDSS